MSKKRSVFWAVLPLVLLLFTSCAVSVGESNASQQKSVDKAVLSASTVPSVSPFDMVKRLGHGINLGNTLDAPTEGDWAAPAKEYYFDDYKAAGFNSVRIPVTWSTHFGTTAPYTVDPVFMARVTQVVNWALARDLAVVLDCHHEDWIRKDYPASQIPRLESLWSQIASNFANSSENLVFEIMNEPQGNITAAQVNDMMNRCLNVIRKTNPTRNVIICGRNYNGWSTLISEVKIPNDSHLIANFHSYDPWDFCGNANGTWGTSQDIADMDSMFSKVKSWSAQKNIPIIADEFGARVQCDSASRINYYKNFCQMARDNDFAYTAWDDAGWFKIYDRSARTFDSRIMPYLIGPVAFSGATYRLVNKCSGKSLDVQDHSTADGGNVQQWDWYNNSNQRWVINDIGGGYYKLVSVNSSKVLEVEGILLTDGANVDQWSWNGGDNQRWAITYMGGGYYKLTAKHSGKCLDVESASTDNGANVQQWHDNGTDAQRWQLIKQ